jgi:hypothetical protein
VILLGFIGGLAFQWMGAMRLLAAGSEDAAAQAQRVTVRQLVLLDGQGRERATLGMTPTGPQLAMKDEAGRPRAMVGQIGEGEHRYWMFALLDASGHGRAQVFAHVDGLHSGFKVVDNHGQPRFDIGFSDQGNGGISMFDQHGRQRFSLGMPAHAGYSLHFLDEDGEDVWSAP